MRTETFAISLKRTFLFLASVLAVTACHRDAAVVSGTFSTSGRDTLLLRVTDNPAAADTVVLPPSGAFKIKKTLSVPAFYDLSVNNQSITLVLCPRESVRLQGDAQNLTGTVRIEGSEASSWILDLNSRMRRTLQKKDSIDVQYRNTRNLPRSESYHQQLMEQYTLELQALRRHSIEFVKAHKSSLAALYALYQKVTPKTYVFSQEEDLQYFQMVDTCLFQAYPTMPLVVMLHRNVQEMSDQLRKRHLEQMIDGLGSPAADFTARDAGNRQVAFSSLRGKYVLLFFWTSWNDVSREWNKDLSRLYNLFSGRNFEICQVSFDYTYQSWTQASREDGIVWTNLWEPAGFSSETATAYRVDQVPMMWLVDPDGMVIARQLTLSQLQKKLDDVLPKD